jgi:hypothetical protein
MIGGRFVSLPDRVFRLGVCALGFFLAFAAHGAVPSEQAARLGLTGTELTPLGALRAGDDTLGVPEWTGGLEQPPPGYRPGGWYVDPFAEDKPLFRVDASNVEQYRDRLTPGTLAMLRKYPESFHLDVYPTRRSASFPGWYYDGSMRNATQVRFCDPPPGARQEERCIAPGSYVPGIFFPLPETGAQALWNSTFRYTGAYFQGDGNGFNAFADGGYAQYLIRERTMLPHMLPDVEKPAHPYFNRWGGATFCNSQEFLDPPRTAGTINGGCSFMERVQVDAYLYVPGQRRVRKAPEIGFYDSPGTGSDGLRTSDQRGVFFMTGTEEWYDYLPLRQAAVLLPYNSYRLASPEVGFPDIVRAGHVNSDLKRYELRRVWVLEAQLSPAYRHLGPRRVVYLDEDSWTPLGGEMYDAKGSLWRVSEVYPINYYDAPMVQWWGDDTVDLVSGRHTGINAWFNAGKNPPAVNKPFDPLYFTPQGLRKYGVR